MNLNMTYTNALLCLTLTLSAGCSRYAITLNDAVIYNPPQLLTDYQVSDSALSQCIEQAVIDGSYSTIGDVQRIVCTHAGVISLKGLEQFSNLEELILSSNAIKSISPIAYLSELEILVLDDNKLLQAPELLRLPRLKTISLAENPNLNCRDLLQLKASFAGTLRIPSQCQAK